MARLIAIALLCAACGKADRQPQPASGSAGSGSATRADAQCATLVDMLWNCGDKPALDPTLDAAQQANVNTMIRMGMLEACDARPSDPAMQRTLACSQQHAGNCDAFMACRRAAATAGLVDAAIDP